MLDKVQVTVLPNGAQVVTAPQPDAESVALGYWVGVGARHESARNSGICHFIEHMLFKGTRRRTARDISQAIEGRGGYFNAYTQEDSTCYYARLPHEKLSEAFDVLVDMYLEPKFDKSDIERERGVIVEELRMYHDQPQYVVQEKLTEALWPGHALGRPIGGFERTLKSMDSKVLGDFHKRHYQPGATVFAFAGRLEHARAVELVESYTGKIRLGHPRAFEPVNRSVRPEPMRLERREIEQVHAAIGFRCFGRHDNRRFAMRLLNSILGENMSSRLFQIVREKHGLAYAVQSSYQLFDETGAFTISAGLDRARAPKALDLISRELARIRTQPVNRAELGRAREYLQGQFRLGLEGTSSQMQWIGETLTHYGHFVSPDEALANLMAVTADDLQDVASELFAPKNMTLSLVVPSKDPATESAWLKNLSAIK
jgi:predicted Zn-dependent peptidase